MAAFPNVKPAFTLKPMIGGTVAAEPGFSPALNANFVGTGNDYVHGDPDQKKLRLDAHAVLKTDDGAIIYVHYKGTVNVTEDLGKILSGTAGDLETPYGDSFTYLDFETGDERYKDLENGIFVSQGHFIAKTGEKTIIEYRVSQVIQG
ncbi:hypothetical protein Plec18167_006051 [Paecilomyces lecythidis]|uniref:Uncharacterized protein n=1 Tax=Paecilomyces lecythidis TaxID=3004212 RepID=A0ABR3XEJ1_9EURO